jgi:hypothetical protein
MLLHNSGGKMMRMIRRCTDWLGGSCVSQKMKEAWVSGIFTLLI